MITSLGFGSSHHDSALFVKYTSTTHIMLSLYMDDMIITSNDIEGIAVQKFELTCCFTMKDLSSLHYFLDIKLITSIKVYR